MCISGKIKCRQIVNIYIPLDMSFCVILSGTRKAQHLSLYFFKILHKDKETESLWLPLCSCCRNTFFSVQQTPSTNLHWFLSASSPNTAVNFVGGIFSVKRFAERILRGLQFTVPKRRDPPARSALLCTAVLRGIGTTAHLLHLQHAENQHLALLS